MQQWRREHARPYDWATQGKSSESAAWHHSLIDEAATADGLASATTFMDLVKAFEMVSLHLIWEAGLRHGFPQAVLKLMLEAFAFSRRLSYQGAVSDSTDTLSALLAGGGFAQDALFLVLLDPLDRMHVQYSTGVTLCEYVDDIAIHVVGSPNFVASTLAMCTDDLVKTLEDTLGMKVSRRDSWANEGKAKTITAVSSPALGRRINTSMRRMGILVTRKAKHLGIHHGPGAKTRGSGRTTSRWSANVARRARVIKLGRRLGRHIFTTGLRPATLYGTTVAVLSKTTVRDMRKAAGSTLGRRQGRSLTARLTVNQCDPGWDATRNPIVAWANEAWLARVPRRTMQRAWMQGQLTVNRSAKPHASAGGAAGSFFAALRTVGWSSPTYDSVITLDGTTLMLSQNDSKTVQRFLWDDYQVSTAAATSLLYPKGQHAHVDLAGGHAAKVSVAGGLGYATLGGRLVPWFDPAAAVLSSKSARSMAPAAVASVSCLPEGGWWTQARLFAAGLATNPFCQLCQKAEGTLRHRLFQCPHRKQHMDAECPEGLAKKAADEPNNPLFTIGVPLRPECPPPPRSGELDWEPAKRWSCCLRQCLHGRRAERHRPEGPQSWLGLPCRRRHGLSLGQVRHMLRAVRHRTTVRAARTCRNPTGHGGTHHDPCRQRSGRGWHCERPQMVLPPKTGRSRHMEGDLEANERARGSGRSGQS